MSFLGMISSDEPFELLGPSTTSSTSSSSTSSFNTSETTINNIVCDICGSGETDPANDILLCDGFSSLLNPLRPDNESCAYHLNRSRPNLEGAFHQMCHVPPIFVASTRINDPWCCADCHTYVKPDLIPKLTLVELNKLSATVKSALRRVVSAEDVVRVYTETRHVQQLLVQSKCPAELLTSRRKLAKAELDVHNLINALDAFIGADSKSGAPRVGPDPPSPQSETETEASSIRKSEVDSADVKCTVCFSGEENAGSNEILLCDGFECRRAFHMCCVDPIVVASDFATWDDDENWYCPYCQARADLIHYVNEEYCTRNSVRCPSTPKSPRSPQSPKIPSLVWAEPEDIFFYAAEAYEKALRAEKIGFDPELCGATVQKDEDAEDEFDDWDDEDTSDEEFIGENEIKFKDDDSGSDSDSGSNSDAGSNAGSNTDDNDDELDKINDDELAALSDAEHDPTSNDSEVEKLTRSLRVNAIGYLNLSRSVAVAVKEEEKEEGEGEGGEEHLIGIVSSYVEEDDTFEISVNDNKLKKIVLNRGQLQTAIFLSHSLELTRRAIEAEGRVEIKVRTQHPGGLRIKAPDGVIGGAITTGDFDVKNIVVGKRQRKAIDYRQLNDALFGEFSPATNSKMFGEAADGEAVDYVPKRQVLKKPRSGYEFASSSDGGSGDEEESERESDGASSSDYDNEKQAKD